MKGNRYQDMIKKIVNQDRKRNTLEFVLNKNAETNNSQRQQTQALQITNTDLIKMGDQLMFFCRLNMSRSKYYSW